jgi:RNase P/RNase MRP subunit POP5
MENTSTSVFDLIIWSGAALSVLGLIGLGWCILRVTRAKRAKLDDDAMRELLRTALLLNLGALFLSMIGLMMVIVGIFLG